MVISISRYWLISFVLTFTFVIKASFLFGQIEIEPAVSYPFTPENLIENVFLGDGVKVTGIQFNGKPEALGYFSNGLNDIGFEEGLLLTTGEAFQADKPNVNEGFGAINNSTETSQELESLAFGELNDVIEYVITFIPTTDSVEFRYRFASEEYPEFSIDCFHDVFGFFISGPGFPAAGQNMAIVPGTNSPVSVSTIHPIDTDLTNGANCPTPPPNVAVNEHLYIDNTGSPNLEYDGFTQTLLAKAKVTPCQEYTLKLVLADVEDDLYDSAVFLESKSFSSSDFNANITGIGLDGSIVEGCSSADLVFSISTPRPDDYEINFAKIGNATVGDDFDDFPSSVTIPTGQLSTSFTITAKADTDVELNDSIGIEIQISQCLFDTIWIPIKDAQLTLPDLGNDFLICEGDTVQLLGPPNNPVDSVLKFEETGINEQIKEIQEDRSNPINDQPSIFNLEVKDIAPGEVVPGLIHAVCININHVKVGQLDVFLQSPSGQFIELATDNGDLDNHYTNTCFTPVATTSIVDGTAPYTGDYAPEGNLANFYGDKVNGTWSLIVRDDDGIGGTDPKGTMLSWSISFNNDYRVDYEWDQADSLSCLDCTEPMAFPSETTTYTLKATDSYGCSASEDITVNVQQLLTAPVITCSDITQSEVTINWELIDGASDYEINIDNSGWNIPNLNATQHRISGLAEGQQVAVEVRANSSGPCSATTETMSCATATCAAPLPQLDSLKDVSCNGIADGQISVSTPTDAFFVIGNDTSELGTNVMFNSLANGDFKVYVLDPSKTCSDSLDVTIMQPTRLNLDIITTQNISCFGGKDGLITVNGSGGTSPYSYSWTNTVDPTFSATDLASIDTLAIGDYELIVRDSNGCEDLEIIQLQEPPSMILDTIRTDVSCFERQDGSITIDANPVYNNLGFNWDNGAQTAAINSLSAGDYSIIVSNDAGCEETRAFTINTPPAITISESSNTPESCTDKRDGTITVEAQGGLGGFDYLWNDAQNQTAATAVNLTAQNYEVIATDQTGCSQNLTVTLNAISDISINPALQEVSCFGESDGQVELTIMGGTPNYNISWSDNIDDGLDERTNLAAGNYQVIVSDDNDCSTTLDFTIDNKLPINLAITQEEASCNASDGRIVVGITNSTDTYNFQWSDDNTRTTATASNLNKGDYTITVTDQAGCSVTEMIMLNEKDGVQLATTTTPILCIGEETGTATVVATGGSGNYIYLWDDQAATEQPTIQNVAAGDYMVLVIDDLGCESTENVTISDNSIPLNLSLDKSDISCFGETNGQITSNIAGNNSAVSYQWSNGQTSPNLSNIAAADYQLTVTDANNCEHTANITVSEPPAIVITTNLDSISCPGENDGAFRIEPSGGTIPYSYSLDGNRYGPSNEFRNLVPGNYEPAFRDANNCVIAIAPFELKEALPLSVTLENLEVKENEISELMPIVSNGSGALTFIWTANDLSDLSCADCLNPILTPTISQLYNLEVIDETGCESEIKFRVLVRKNRDIYVPTGFSPNFDGHNDFLSVHGVPGTEILSFKVFDRWGELVFSGQPFLVNDEAAGWDGNFKGKPMTTNVYAWIVEARFSDGTVKVEKGNSTLVR